MPSNTQKLSAPTKNSAPSMSHTASCPTHPTSPGTATQSQTLGAPTYCPRYVLLFLNATAYSASLAPAVSSPGVATNCPDALCVATSSVQSVSSKLAQQCQPLGFSAPSLTFRAITNEPTVKTIFAFGAPLIAANDPLVVRCIVSVRFAAIVASPNCAKLQRVSLLPV